MYQLSEQQAQDIVDKMMQDIPYNINIMNAEGIIIGSGNRKRIGTVHQGAVKALATGKMVEVWEDGLFEKKGTNEPIVINHKRVGVIGITGNPVEVRPFCNIVRTTVALLIEQGMALKALENEANRKKAFVEMLLQHQGIYTQKLKREAMSYNIDLMLSTTVLYIQRFRMDREQAKLFLLYPSFMIDGDTHLFFIQNEGEIEKAIKLLLQGQPDMVISYGRHEAQVADSYRQAKQAMSVLHALKLPKRIISYEEVEFLVKLSQAELTDSESLITKLEDKESVDLMDTLRSFINHNGSVSATAASLNIHRNTLQYRLKRIADLTGKDPRHLLELFELVHGLLAFYR
ncbi:CdaR family transcriptional regulator [Paenibacillus sp. 1001270B_150601_E10]|uniref:CdaR family transcriptional regulator n=1 Tax=Paenibacillus sp. 1001270B_150601_E10 TaxID=2787079 RepID=UPI00189E0AFD|nr:sugar diacid recognition domain-containing protein [Paenibacillus sp. 1001270B_150601_E10]